MFLKHDTVIICAPLAKQLNLAFTGKKNFAGAAIGPRNNEWLNGTHPMLLYDLQCNSDTLLTYRLPVNKHTHSPACQNAECLAIMQEKSAAVNKSLMDVIAAAQQAQRDQANPNPKMC